MKPTTILLFVLTFVFGILNLFNISTSFYAGALIALTIHFFVVPIIVAKSGLSVKAMKVKSDERKEFFLSLLRHAITILGTLIALKIQIPFVDTLLEALRFVSDSFNLAYDAVTTLIGLVMQLVGIIWKKERFAARAEGNLIEGKRIS